MAESEFRWTQDAWGSDTEATERRASTRNERLAWFGVLTVAVVAFELTTDPALSVALGCMKFGWDEIRGALCSSAAEVAGVLRARGWTGVARPCSLSCRVAA